MNDVAGLLKGDGEFVVLSGAAHHRTIPSHGLGTGGTAAAVAEHATLLSALVRRAEATSHGDYART